MGSKTKSRNGKRSDAVIADEISKAAGELAAQLDEIAKDDELRRDDANLFRKQMEGGWNSKDEIIIPKSLESEANSLVNLLKEGGYGVFVRPMKATNVLPQEFADNYLVLHISGERTAKSTASPVPKKTGKPPLLEDWERAFFEGKCSRAQTIEQKMALLEKYSRNITRDSSETLLTEFSIMYRGMQELLRETNSEKLPAGITDRFGKLVPLMDQVNRKLSGREANLPEVVPVKSDSSETESAPASSQEAQPARSAKPESKVEALRTLLNKPEPASKQGRDTRFYALLGLYSDTELANKLQAKYVLLTQRLKDVSQAKDKEEKKRLADEVRSLEADVSLYREWVLQLRTYAPSDADRAEATRIGKALWAKRHMDMFNYSRSETALLSELRKMKLDSKLINSAYAHVQGNLDPRYNLGQTLEMGSGKAAEKKATALAATLRKYRQLMLDGSTVRVVKRYESGKEIWAVEMGSPEACARKRVQDAAARGTNVPITRANSPDFRDSLDNLYAQRIGDSNMDAKEYASAYSQIREIGVGGKERYNITFPNKEAAGAFYSLISGFGPAHGFYAVGDIRQRGSEWVVSLKAPAQATAEGGSELAEVREEAEVVAPPKPEPAPAEITTEPVEGTKELGLSAATMAWIRSKNIFPKKQLAAYKKAAAKYEELEKSKPKSKAELEKLVPYAEACRDITSAHIKELERLRLKLKKERPKDLAAFDAYVEGVKKARARSVSRFSNLTTSISLAAIEEQAAQKKGAEAAKAEAAGAEELLKRAQLVDRIMAWAGPAAGAFLRDESRLYAGKTHRQVLEQLAANVSQSQLDAVLGYLNNETSLLSRGLQPSGRKLSLLVSAGANMEAVKEGLSLLYAASGLALPRFRLAAVRHELSGKKHLIAIGLPQEYVPPSMELSLPEPNEAGYVTIKGRQIYLPPAQKAALESALLEGKAFSLTVKKDAAGKQVDTAGAYLLAQYLRERGWSNVDVKAWNPKKKVSAKAAVSAEAAPSGYWDRPALVKAIEKRNLLEDSERLTRLVEERIEKEQEAMFYEGTETRARLSLPDDGIVKAGNRNLAVLDAVPESLQNWPSTGGAQRNAGEHRAIEARRIASQKAQLEEVANDPSAYRRIAYTSRSRANAAASFMQYWFRSRNDPRTVSVEKGAVFKRTPHTRTYYLVVGKPLTATFAQTAQAGIRVPASYRYYSSAYKREVELPLLNSAEDRVRLQYFLNGSGGTTADFYATTEAEEGLRTYLRENGFNMDAVSSETIGGISEVPKDRRAALAMPVAGERKFVRITLSLAQEDASAVEEVGQDAELRRRRLSELSETLSGKTDADFAKYAQANPKSIRAIMIYAEKPELMHEGRSITFLERDGGEKMARRMYDLLSASGLFPGVSIKANQVFLSNTKSEEGLGEFRGTRGFHAARMAKMNEITSQMAPVYAQAQQASKEFAQDLFLTEENRRNGESYVVSFATGERVSTTQAFERRMAAQEGTSDFSLYYGVFSDSAQQYLANWYGSEPKSDYIVDDIVNLDLKMEKKTSRAFDEDPSKIVMRAFMGMHAGFGVSEGWQSRRPKYWKRVPEMWEVLNKYRNFEEFASELKSTNAGIGTATATYQFAYTATEIICSNKEGFETWDKKRQSAYKSAVFDLMWRVFVANVAFESGPVLGSSTGMAKPAKEEMYAEYRALLVSHLNGTGDNSTFMHKGKEYAVLQSLLVRSSGQNLLCVPPEKPAEGIVRAVMGRQLSRTKSGNYIWKIVDLPDRDIRINKYDSLGPLGATGWNSGDVFMLEGNSELEKKEEVPVKEKKIEVPEMPQIQYEEVTKTIGGKLLPIDMGYIVPRKDVRSSTEAVWTGGEIALAMRVPKKDLFENVKDARVGTITVEDKEITLKGGKKSTVRFILPPRFRYDENRKEEEAVRYPRGLYASAYIWNNNVYVIDYSDKSKMNADATRRFPSNAKDLYSSSNEALAEDGLSRVRIGKFNPLTGTISFESKEYEQEYSKHIYGQILLSSNMMNEMTKEEVQAFSGEAPMDGVNYYLLKPVEAGASERIVSSQVGVLIPIPQAPYGTIPTSVETGGRKKTIKREIKK
ncbi:hypothetical protein JW721_01310 [Candidatus Micrarchaeota archaeon]|nr:hypothetical protein [Candidatus Micrarchaeota archaeon]